MGFRALVITTFLSMQALAQTVVSARSGLIDYMEGAVFLDGAAISRINGRFPEIREGVILSTNTGKAEVLLNPEVFLWLAPDSAIRMEHSDLSDTRVNLLEGSVVVQAQELLSGNTVNLLHASSQVRASAQSLYRFDLSPARLNVLAGDANITIGAKGLIVEGPRSLDLKSGLVSPLPVSKPDAFDNWVRERRKLIANETRQAEAGLSKKHRHSIAWPFPAAGAPLPRRTW